jgi:hypothetical protein
MPAISHLSILTCSANSLGTSDKLTHSVILSSYFADKEFEAQEDKNSKYKAKYFKTSKCKNHTRRMVSQLLT